jgi:hypothetical protein
MDMNIVSGGCTPNTSSTRANRRGGWQRPLTRDGQKPYDFGLKSGLSAGCRRGSCGRCRCPERTRSATQQRPTIKQTMLPSISAPKPAQSMLRSRSLGQRMDEYKHHQYASGISIGDVSAVVKISCTQFLISRYRPQLKPSRPPNTLCPPTQPSRSRVEQRTIERRRFAPQCVQTFLNSCFCRADVVW